MLNEEQLKDLMHIGNLIRSALYKITDYTTGKNWSMVRGETKWPSKRNNANLTLAVARRWEAKETD